MKQFIQQNLFVVIAVGVAILALAVVVFPYTEVSEATGNAARLERLHDELTQAIGRAESPLWVALSRKGIEDRRLAQERVIETSLLVAYRQPLLVNGRMIFPAPGPVDRFDFRSAYSQSFAKWLKDMEARHLPTLAEMKPILEAEPAAPGATTGGPGEEKTQFERLRNREIAVRADKCRIWASEECFDKYIQPAGIPLNDRELWEAQLNWWVQKDLVEVVTAVNTEKLRVRTLDGQERTGLPPGNVRESPIKELVWIDVLEQYYRGPATDAAGGPGAAPSGGTLTGHVTGPKFDVILYSCQLVMDPQQLPLLVGKLSSRNFHTVLSLKYDTLDRKGRARGSGVPHGMPMMGPAGAAEGQPDYGPDPVAVVTIQGEVVFMKSPQSWREAAEKDREVGRRKRLDFLAKHPDLVLEIHRVQPDGRSQVVLAHSQLVKDPSALGNWLKQDDPTLQFISLYEDLIPPTIKAELPGFAPAGPGGPG